ncbi:MAG: anaerobic dehydrogenase, partial [Gammaproteobacteria bacterium]
RRAGHDGNRLTQGVALFRAILDKREGTLISVNEFGVFRVLRGFDVKYRFPRTGAARLERH